MVKLDITFDYESWLPLRRKCASISSMKICSHCKNDLPLSDFNINRSKVDGLSYVCKYCQRQYTKQHYKDNKTYYKKKARSRNLAFKEALDLVIHWLKDQPCMDCGGKFHPWQMDFDHVRGKKLYNLAQIHNKTQDMEVVLQELAKCEVVCSNCHRDRTYKRSHASASGSGTTATNRGCDLGSTPS